MHIHCCLYVNGAAAAVAVFTFGGQYLGVIDSKDIYLMFYASAVYHGPDLDAVAVMLQYFANIFFKWIAGRSEPEECLLE